jgi:hypothetical protein
MGSGCELVRMRCEVPGRWIDERTDMVCHSLLRRSSTRCLQVCRAADTCESKTAYALTIRAVIYKMW